MCVGHIEFSEQHDIQTNGMHYRSRPPAANVTRKSLTLRESYEKITAPVEVSLSKFHV